MNSELLITALATTDGDFQAAIRNALRLWASAVTASSSEQRADLLRYKQRVVASFFDFVVGKSLVEITAQDVETWRDDMTKRGLKPATVYARVCFLSSFFGWAMRDPQLKAFITSNPARLALPKPPKAYQTEKVKAWTDAELQAIVEVVREKAAGDDIVGKRDYAILLFFLVTGMRRQEIISLRGGSIKLGDDSIIMTGKVKGGDYVGREVRDQSLRAALVEYLSACGRLDVLKRDAPLWTRHDNAGQPGAPLNSHSFAKNLKRYAKAADVDGVHIHQTRHSFARIVAEETGSITDVQDALGHRNAATTRVYVQRIAIKRDKHSESITRRMIKRER